MKYPIIFYCGNVIPIYLFIKGAKPAGGLPSDTAVTYLSPKGIKGINSGKYKWHAFDSDGAEYKVSRVIKRRLRLSLLDLLSFHPTYYVDFEFKEVGRYDLPDFKDRVLKIMKKGARDWKKDGHDSQTDGFTIGKIVKAESIQEIINTIMY